MRGDQGLGTGRKQLVEKAVLFRQAEPDRSKLCPVFALFQRHHALLRVGFQGCREHAVAPVRLGRGEAAEGAGQAAQLADERREHLQQGIGKAEFKNRAGDNGIQRFLADDQPRPCLFTANGLCIMDGVGIVGGEPCLLYTSPSPRDLG